MVKWTANDIPDQAGRIAVVTGATSGLGAVTARELARAGAHVVLAVRDLERGGTVAEEIRASARSATVDVLRLDLAELESVRDFAAAYRGQRERLDLLVNNAGVMALPHRLTADGFEMQLGTNHLGPFALTGLLLGSLLAAPAPRVVTVSSAAHRIGNIDFDDLQGERHYRRWQAYGQSKLANLLFARELQRSADAAGATLRSVSAHPGYAATNLQLRGPRMAGNRIDELANKLLNRTIAQDAEMGALPSLYAATMPDLAGGAYIGPGGPLELRGHPKHVKARPAADDPDIAARLWEVSEELTGVRFDWSAATVAPAG